MLTFEVTLLDGSAPIVVSSQLLNRQDGEDEYHVADHALGKGFDPRKMRPFDHRVLVPRLHRERGGEVVLGYRCANSGMTLACAYHHLVDTPAPHGVETTVGEDLAKTVVTARMHAGEVLRLVKLVSYHTSTGVPGRGARRPLPPHARQGDRRRPGDAGRRAAGVARPVLGAERRRAVR